MYEGKPTERDRVRIALPIITGFEYEGFVPDSRTFSELEEQDDVSKVPYAA